MMNNRNAQSIALAIFLCYAQPSIAAQDETLQANWSSKLKSMAWSSAQKTAQAVKSGMQSAYSHALKAVSKDVDTTEQAFIDARAQADISNEIAQCLQT